MSTTAIPVRLSIHTLDNDFTFYGKKTLYILLESESYRWLQSKFDQNLWEEDCMTIHWDIVGENATISTGANERHTFENEDYALLYKILKSADFKTINYAPSKVWSCYVDRNEKYLIHKQHVQMDHFSIPIKIDGMNVILPAPGGVKYLLNGQKGCIGVAARHDTGTYLATITGSVIGAVAGVTAVFIISRYLM